VKTERIPIQDRASWLAMRQRDVTASVAGALLGVHEYQTAYGLWALKAARIAEDPEENPAMRRGRLLEDDALQILAEDHPTWTVTPANDVYHRAPELRLGATPDAFVTIPSRPGRGLLQVKTVASDKYRRDWLADGAEDPEVPLWIAIQAIVETKLSGADYALVAPLIVGHGLDVVPVEVPIHDGVFARVVEETAAFWELVESGRDPEPDYGRDTALIGRVYARDDGTEIDLSRDNRMPDLLARRDRRKSYIRAAQQSVDRIEAEIKTKIGVHERAHVPGWRLTWSVQERAGRYQPPSSTRVLRINPAR
jgi:predicted phage-related endonuclease